jgi:hypothetical protein
VSTSSRAWPRLTLLPLPGCLFVVKTALQPVPYVGSDMLTLSGVPMVLVVDRYSRHVHVMRVWVRLSKEGRFTCTFSTPTHCLAVDTHSYDLCWDQPILCASLLKLQFLHSFYLSLGSLHKVSLMCGQHLEDNWLEGDPISQNYLWVCLRYVSGAYITPKEQLPCAARQLM